jgi:hypothetical protein
MKVAELEGALLAEWVARANGWPVEIEDVDEPDSPLYCRDDRGIPWSFTEHGYWPQVKWEQAGPLIDREKITVIEGRWGVAFRACVCFCYDFDLNDWIDGDTYLTAAMRAYVASKFGDEVADDTK